MDKITPQKPLRADHRFMLKLASSVLDGVEFIPSEFNRVARVFSKMGGSWERIFKGSPFDVSLLKRVLKKAAKHGYLTKKESW